LASLISKESRVKFARYKLTGVLDQNSKYATGNPTLNLLPEKMHGYMLHKEDNLFDSIGVTF